MSRLTDVNRRTYLLGAGATAALATGVPATIGDSHGDEDLEDHLNLDEHPDARPVLGDVESTGFENVMHYDGDPADEEREWVVHVTSEGTATRDYAASLINVSTRVEDDTVALGDLEEGTLEFEYFEGPEHTTSAPNDVLLALQTPEQASDDGGTVLFRTIDDGEEAPDDLDDGEWRTADVVDEMRSEKWKAVEIDDPRELKVHEQTVDEVMESGPASLRDRDDDIRDIFEDVDDVFDEYDVDTTLIGIGVGAGNILQQTTTDIYYDELTIETDQKNVFDFPAAVPMDVELDPDTVGDGDDVTAQLELTQEEEGIETEDLLEDTVTLYAYSKAAPPIENGVQADDVQVTDEGIDATFEADQVTDLERIDTGDQSVIVAGEFDYEQAVWFVAEAEITIEE